MKKVARVYTVTDAVAKAQKYCAYQERCHAEVLQKLRDWELPAEKHGQVMAELIASNFINEERFARAFARGKFRLKKWGRQRILLELKKRQISDYCLRVAMQEIPEEDYTAEILQLIEKKLRSIKDTHPAIVRKKIGSYLISKGYEPALVWETLKDYPK